MKKTSTPKSVEVFLVGMTGFEPATSASRTQRSTKLSHIPKSIQFLTKQLYHLLTSMAMLSQMQKSKGFLKKTFAHKNHLIIIILPLLVLANERFRL